MIRRWKSDPDPLTEDELIAAYSVPDRSVPMVRANMVSSLDGAVSLEGKSGGLSSKDDQDMLGRLRMLADAILVGAGTVRAEGYDALRLRPARRDWRRENGLSDNGVLAIVSGRLDLDPASAPFVKSPVRPIVLTSAVAPADRRARLEEVADVLICGDAEVQVTEVVKALNDRGLLQLLCEGGPRLLGSLTGDDLVDELCLTVSPLLAGPGAARITNGAASTAVRQLKPLHYLLSDDGFLFTRYGRA
ncbi:riboflavin biosynthesis pyrimidine reductase [Kribbella amoyensis]|uniref:Riboflavin biosynthesis pyrimidine reductase n=1 Tax=Kribbella amoyensis TaxID=996641 RepID=A0A561B7N1_9ACTN|nr:pyrimidine reductase family protein [Kribbella amoyensis]TWD74976.1 riboflavin biosynthesis pyrimidine reductase [Kribbella amoyensis]